MHLSVSESFRQFIVSVHRVCVASSLAGEYYQSSTNRLSVEIQEGTSSSVEGRILVVGLETDVL